MGIKIFRPKSSKNKLFKSLPPLGKANSNNVTIIPTGTASGNTTIPGTGTWVNVPVGKTIYSYGPGTTPIIDLDIEVEETRDGLNCSKCKEFYPYAMANQDDGKTLICYACRNGY